MKQAIEKIVLKAGKERSIINKHPWVFSGAIAKMPDLPIGTMLAIYSADMKPLALAHWCGNQGISARIFSFSNTEAIDEKFWLAFFDNAQKLRQELHLPNEQNTGYRFLHGEGDYLSGLVCDIYGSSASIELSNPGLYGILPILTDFLSTKLNIEHIFLRNLKEEVWLKGFNERAMFLENGLKFIANIGTGQKTGLFLFAANQKG
jgi:23S rRNA (cytosine1962-C5)-methyltransferase